MIFLGDYASVMLEMVTIIPFCEQFNLEGAAMRALFEATCVYGSGLISPIQAGCDVVYVWHPTVLLTRLRRPRKPRTRRRHVAVPLPHKLFFFFVKMPSVKRKSTHSRTDVLESASSALRPSLQVRTLGTDRKDLPSDSYSRTNVRGCRQ